MPSPDLDESVQILNERNGGVVGNFDFNEHFVKRHSNHALSKIIVYTKGKSPEETRDEIIGLLKLDEKNE